MTRVDGALTPDIIFGFKCRQPEQHCSNAPLRHSRPERLPTAKTSIRTSANPEMGEGMVDFEAITSRLSFEVRFPDHAASDLCSQERAVL